MTARPHSVGKWLAVAVALGVGLAAPAPAQLADGPENAPREENGGLFAFLEDASESGQRPLARPHQPGSVSVAPYGFALAGLDDEPSADLYGGGVGVNYFVMEDVAVRGELYGLRADQSGDDANGGGFNLLGRWHFLREGAWSLFAEGGAGVLQTDVSLPDGRARRNNDGTHFNFSTHAGVGAKYRLGDGTSLIGAFRYTHISNAGLSGSDENPGINAIGGYFGIRIRF